jgi:glycosyltransferase involved in cell wall biosynthesis
VSKALVVIPTLGTRDHWLPAAIASVTCQPTREVEVVVVAPTDSSAAEIAANCGVDYLAFDRAGLSAAINAAWIARGGDADYLAWLGDDDMLAPLSLVATMDHLDRAPSCVAVYGRARVLDPLGDTALIGRPGRFASVMLPYATDQVPQPGSLFRAGAVRQSGYLDEGLEYSMDYDLLLKLRRFGSLDYLPMELAAIRSHKGRISENRTDSGAEERMVRQRNWTPRERAFYTGLRRLMHITERGYVSVLRRMPADNIPQIGGVSYVERCPGQVVDPKSGEVVDQKRR